MLIDFPILLRKSNMIPAKDSIIHLREMRLGRRLRQDEVCQFSETTFHKFNNKGRCEICEQELPQNSSM